MNRTGSIDLAGIDPPSLDLETDVCIIGAGAAGAYLARALVAHGRDVVVLEAGPVTCLPPHEAGFDAEFSPAAYPGAVSGRYFGVGGSTSRWGGLLAPHTRFDLRPASHDGFTDVWRWVTSVVADESSAVLAALGYQGIADFDTFPSSRLAAVAHAAIEGPFHAQAGLYLPFRRKNLAWLLAAAAVGPGRCRLIHGAVAKEWQIEPGGGRPRVAAVTAVARGGRILSLRARQFVIAAGAIESTRIVLEIDRCAPAHVLPASSAVGCYLADHLSVAIADVAAADRRSAASLFAPRFSGNWMRGYRFLEREQPAAAPRCFLHVIFENENPGFLLAKEVLVAMQGRRLPHISPRMVLHGASGLCGLAYARYAASRLYIPPNTPARLQLDIEQGLDRDNRITLSDRRDGFGRPVPHIHWRVSDDDARMIAETAARMLTKWPRAGGLPRLEPRSLGADGTKPHDAYHPVGSCRMGSDGEAVVNRDLRVAGLDNAWVASTAVLPGAGTANPTFTLLCLANRLARTLPSDG
jgi:choline dehydrogenase-like flavoprotein